MANNFQAGPNLPSGKISPRKKNQRICSPFVFAFLLYLITAGLVPPPARATIITYMFASDAHSGYLKRIDMATGAATPVGPIGAAAPGKVWGISASPWFTILYGVVEASQFELWTIDIITGAGTPVGPLGYDIRELAFDPVNNVLYGTDFGYLFTIDQGTGAATFIGPFLPVVIAWALDFDTATGRLYGVDAFREQLFWADPSTGLATLLGERWVGTGRATISDIAFDWQTGLLYGIEGGEISDYFFSINKETGATTNIGPMGEPISVRGLAMPIPEPLTLILLGAGLLGLLKRAQKSGKRPTDVATPD